MKSLLRLSNTAKWNNKLLNAWEHQKILRIVPQNNSGLITPHHRNQKESFQVLSHFSLLLLLSWFTPLLKTEEHQKEQSDKLTQ